MSYEVKGFTGFEIMSVCWWLKGNIIGELRRAHDGSRLSTTESQLTSNVMGKSQGCWLDRYTMIDILCGWGEFPVFTPVKKGINVI